MAPIEALQDQAAIGEALVCNLQVIAGKPQSFCMVNRWENQIESTVTEEIMFKSNLLRNW